jgi:hypothetical protein
VDDAAFGEVLAVAAAQVVLHVDEGPVPFEAFEPELEAVGEDGVGEGRGLAEEPVGAAGHAVADGEVALFFGDAHERFEHLGALGRVEGGEQRELRLVHVPHGRDVEHEGAFGAPERALVLGEAGLDERVVEAGGEDGAPLGGAAVDFDLGEVGVPGFAGLGAGAVEGVAEAGPGEGLLEVAAGLVGAAHGEAHADLDGLAGAGGAHEHEAEGAQGGAADVVEVEAGAAVDAAAVVPDELAPSGGRVGVDEDRQGHALHDHGALGAALAEALEAGAEGDGGAVLDGEAAVGEVDDDAGRGGLGEGVAVDGGLLADGELAVDAVLEGRGVVAGFGDLVLEFPAGAEDVEGLDHRGDAEVVVVLADRAGAGLLEVGEAAGEVVVVDGFGGALCRDAVAAVPGGVGAGARAGGDHAEGVAGAGMRVPDLGFRPPP